MWRPKINCHHFNCQNYPCTLLTNKRRLLNSAAPPFVEWSFRLQSTSLISDSLSHSDHFGDLLMTFFVLQNGFVCTFCQEFTRSAKSRLLLHCKTCAKSSEVSKSPGLLRVVERGANMPNTKVVRWYTSSENLLLLMFLSLSVRAQKLLTVNIPLQEKNKKRKRLKRCLLLKPLNAADKVKLRWFVAEQSAEGAT